jgi:hypothetical protein
MKRRGSQSEIVMELKTTGETEEPGVCVPQPTNVAVFSQLNQGGVVGLAQGMDGVEGEGDVRHEGIHVGIAGGREPVGEMEKPDADFYGLVVVDGDVEGGAEIQRNI